MCSGDFVQQICAITKKEKAGLLRSCCKQVIKLHINNQYNLVYIQKEINLNRGLIPISNLWPSTSKLNSLY